MYRRSPTLLAETESQNTGQRFAVVGVNAPINRLSCERRGSEEGLQGLDVPPLSGTGHRIRVSQHDPEET